MSVRWGLLSTAGISRQIVNAARESERAAVVAVASRDLERAKAYAAEHEIERALGSYEALLDDPNVDAVYIGLPNSMHIEWSIRALEAGKHVLCEKPFSRSAADVARAYNAADASGRILMEAFMYRHHPQTAKLVELLADGVIGTPRFIREVFAFNGVRIFAERDNIRFDAELEGGALMDVGAYCVSAARLIGGEPSRVHGIEVRGPSGVDLAFAGTLEFDGGLVAQFECGFTVEGRTELEVLGTEGRLVVREPWRIVQPGIDVWTLDGERHVDIEQVDHYRLELDNLSAAIEGDEAPLLGRDDAVAQAKVLEALALSGRTGDAVAL